MGWGRGRHQPGSRKQFSLSALKQEEISFMQVLGGWQGLIGAWRWATSRPRLDLQQAQGLQAGPGVSFSIYKSTLGQVGGALSPAKPHSPHLKFLMQGSLVLPPKGPSGLPFLWLPLSFICGHCGWTGRAPRLKGIPQGINENSNPNS